MDFCQPCHLKAWWAVYKWKLWHKIFQVTFVDCTNRVHVQHYLRSKVSLRSFFVLCNKWRGYNWLSPCAWHLTWWSILVFLRSFEQIKLSYGTTKSRCIPNLQDLYSRRSFQLQLFVLGSIIHVWTQLHTPRRRTTSKIFTWLEWYENVGCLTVVLFYFRSIFTCSNFSESFNRLQTIKHDLVLPCLGCYTRVGN